MNPHLYIRIHFLKDYILELFADVIPDIFKFWRESTGSSYELHPVALQVAEERSDERTVRGQEQPVGANPSRVRLPLDVQSKNKRSTTNVMLLLFWRRWRVFLSTLSANLYMCPEPNDFKSFETSALYTSLCTSTRIFRVLW